MASLGISLSRPVLVCRVAWVERYQGITDDTPVGGGRFIRDNGYGGEIYNFKSFNGRYYGYVETLASKKGTPKTLNISRLGAPKVDDFVDGVTVFWIATKPKKGGQCVVGWYTNARVYRERQKPQGSLAATRRFQKDSSSPSEVFPYMTEANGQDCVCLGLNERTCPIPKAPGGIGQANVWYPNPQQRGELLKWFSDYLSPPTASTPSGVAHQTDTERRQQVERAAIDAVKDLYRSQGYYVIDVSNKNLGWDLQAEREGTVLKIEIKGISGPNVRAELTPNEYTAMTTKEGYRLCVVTEVLNEMARKVHEFSLATPNGGWQDSHGCVLRVHEQVGAVVKS